MINQDNMIVITTTLTNDTISSLRIENLSREISKFGVDLVINYEEKDNKNYPTLQSRISVISQNNIIKMLDMFKREDHNFGIICDNDYYPNPNLLEELNKTVELLPKGWRCLHLCPAWLWGRKFRRCKNDGRLDTEGNINKLNYHESRRFFINCDPGRWYRKAIWLGGPIAFLVNKENVDSFINDFSNEIRKIGEKRSLKSNNDVLFVRILKENDYVCMEPQLGYENEQGGTTLKP